MEIKSTRNISYMHSIYVYIKYVRSAVGGGADLVRNIDSTLARKSCGEARVEPANIGSKAFQAIASCLAVRGGLGSAVQRPNPSAAGGRHNPTSLHVVDAWCEAAAHLATCYGLCNWCTQDHAHHYHGNQLHYHRACHNEN